MVRVKESEAENVVGKGRSEGGEFELFRFGVIVSNVSRVTDAGELLCVSPSG